MKKTSELNLNKMKIMRHDNSVCEWWKGQRKGHLKNTKQRVASKFL